MRSSSTVRKPWESSRCATSAAASFVVICALLALPACKSELPLSVREFAAPQYPFAARVYHVAGRVSVAIEVGPDGKVRTAKGSGTAPVLVEEAERNVRQWKFKPRKKGPYPVPGAVVYDFKLIGKPSVVGLTTSDFVPPNHVNVVDQPVSEKVPEALPLEGIVEHNSHEPTLLRLFRDCYSKHCANQARGPIDRVPLRELIDCYSDNCQGQGFR